MAVFSWPGLNVVGCPEMDRNHEPALKMLDRLHEAMIRGRGGETVASILAELNEFYPAYFEMEEELLRGSQYPELEEHGRQHQSLLEELAELRRRADAGHLAITYDTMAAMRRWIETHVNVEDRRAALHVMEHRARLPGG